MTSTPSTPMEPKNVTNGLTPCLVGGVGQQQGQQDDGADVEHGDAEDHGVDGLGHDLFRVFGFAGGGADQFDRGVGEQDALHEDDHGQQAVGEDAAVVRDQAEAHFLAVHGGAEDDEVGADQQEGHQRGHLDQGEPEFHLAEDLHARRGSGPGPRPGRSGPRPTAGRPPIQADVLAEEVHVERDGGDVHDGGGGPVDPVEPAGDERGLLAEELAGVGDERAGRRAGAGRVRRGRAGSGRRRSRRRRRR